ncbi:tetratricopeptide repeat protein [Dactylosporangium sucinum]|uniref:tetratricopeptide repeat protein n=1 Tax=Dactylosporangium sucinum TaxID=1424081 RepID=UPI00167D8635|nr:tetratricopeptide repeat protein [Dactylosporangium sucinum]
MTAARVAAWQAARALHQQLLGDDHPHTAWSMNRLADTLYMLGEYPAARDLHERARASSSAVLRRSE